jgi:hypothetical protein
MAVVVSLVAAVAVVAVTWRLSRRIAAVADDIRRRQRAVERRLASLTRTLDADPSGPTRPDTARADLERFRVPLRDAATDLRHRVRAIRDGDLLGHMQSPDRRRRRISAVGTAYRLARFWGVVDTLNSATDMIRFRGDAETAAVARILEDIADTLAADELDGGRLMMWREEQRAVAELMRPATGPPGVAVTTGMQVVGFAAFSRRFDADFADWFTDFLDDLDAPGVDRSERLGRLEDLLDELVDQLDGTPPPA